MRIILKNAHFYSNINMLKYIFKINKMKIHKQNYTLCKAFITLHIPQFLRKGKNLLCPQN